MQVGNLINDIVPQVEKRKRVDDLRCVVKNTLSDDGRFVNQMEIVPVDTENDLRNFFRADDFSLSTVLAYIGCWSGVVRVSDETFTLIDSLGIISCTYTGKFW